MTFALIDRTRAATWISLAAMVVSIVASAYGVGARSHVGRPTVGFVDMQAVMRQSDAGKSLQEQVTPRLDKLKQAAESKLKELKQEQEALARLDDADKADKTAALQKKIADWNAEAEKRQAAINAAAAPAAQKIEAALRDQMESIASENNFTAILPMQSSFYASKGVDVTSDAIRRLNARLSKVEVKFDEAAPTDASDKKK